MSCTPGFAPDAESQWHALDPLPHELALMYERDTSGGVKKINSFQKRHRTQANTGTCAH